MTESQSLLKKTLTSVHNLALSSETEGWKESNSEKVVRGKKKNS